MAGVVRNFLERDGRYFARVVVPPALRKHVGKTELRTSLGADRRLALRALPAAVSAHLEVLAAARRAAQSTEKMSAAAARRRFLPDHELAQIHYAEELQNDLLERAGSGANKAEMNRLFAPARAVALARVASGMADDDEIAALVGWAIGKFAERGHIGAPKGTGGWRSLAALIATVELETHLRSLERDRGNYIGEPASALLVHSPAPETTLQPISITALFEAYILEMKRANGKGGEAHKRWKPVFRHLTDFLKHDNARLLTRSDIMRWKEQIETELAAKTIRDVYIASVRAVLQSAVDRDLLPINAAHNVKVRVPKAQRVRERGFTSEEAVALFMAAEEHEAPASSTLSTRESPFTSAAKRWVIPLCAYTGARVAEITQLRKEDIRESAGISFLRITPDAGSVKNGHYRDVPIHPHIIGLGFSAFVAGSAQGALFYSGSARARGAEHPSKAVARRVATWIRGLGVIGSISPNHAWRHRFKTVGRELGVDPRVLDAIQGHAARTAGENYGEVSLATKLAAIRRFPAYGI